MDDERRSLSSRRESAKRRDIPASSSPLSQQGMAGIRPTLTASGLNRQFHDKRYFLSAIQNHMLIISEEINNLKKQLAEHKLDATNYEECKKQVEIAKKELAEHEETLIIYNTAIEISMFKGSKSDVDLDAEKLRKINQQLISQLESLFSEKLSHEEQITKLQHEIEIEDQLFNEMISKLSDADQQEYHDLWAQNEQYKKDEERLRKEISELQNNINYHEQQVIQNESKRLRYNLMVKLNELTRRRDKIVEENKVKRSPSEEREYLLEQVKQDRSDMESFRAQEEQCKEEAENLRERLNELKDELSEKNSARLNKYRELLKRQETMESFLGTYDEVYEEQVNKLSEIRTNVVFSLEYISGNLTDANLDDIENTKNYEIDPNVSKDELKQEYKKLSSQLKMLNSLYDHYQNELTSLKEQRQNYVDELKMFENIDVAREELFDRQQSLQIQKDLLTSELQATNSAVAEVEKKQRELENELKNNDTYRELSELEGKFSKLKVENEKQVSAIENIKMLDNFEKFKSEAMACVQDISANLEEKYMWKEL